MLASYLHETGVPESSSKCDDVGLGKTALSALLACLGALRVCVAPCVFASKRLHMGSMPVFGGSKVIMCLNPPEHLGKLLDQGFVKGCMPGTGNVALRERNL